MTAVVIMLAVLITVLGIQTDRIIDRLDTIAALARKRDGA